MLTAEQIKQVRLVLLEKLHRYTVEWPALPDPPAHLGLKQAVAVPYIRRALQKIDDGTYGICDDCGEEIALRRLENVVGANRCRDCEESVAGTI